MQFDLNDFLESTRCMQIKGVSVWQNGSDIGRFEAAEPTTGNLYSGTKSFLSAAAGFAVTEGLFQLDDRIADLFCNDLPAHISEFLEDMRVKHLLSMSMGFVTPLLMGDVRHALRLTEQDWVKYCLRQPVAQKPGHTFLYSNAGPYLAGVLIQRLSGQNLLDFLKIRLLDPLQIHISQWETCPQGYIFGASGFVTDLDGFSKFGRLYLQYGEWQGKQLLPKEWVTASGHQQIYTPGDDETGHGYGYGFWTLPNDAWRVEGKYGQYCLICPGKNAVVTIMADYRPEEELGRPILRAALRTIINCL